MDRNKVYINCCLPQCHGYRYALTHKIPLSKDRFKKWIEVLPQLSTFPYEKLSTSAYLCSRHFRVKDYVHEQSPKLNRTAVPCLNLKDLSELHLCRQTEKEKSTMKGSSIASELLKRAQLEEEDDENKNVKILTVETINDDEYEEIGCESETEQDVVIYDNVQDLEKSLLNSVHGETIAQVAVAPAAKKFKMEPADNLVNAAEAIPANTDDFNVSYKNKKINIVFKGICEEPIEVDVKWLRSQCLCALCLAQNFSYENIIKMGLKCSPKALELKIEEQLLEVKWSNEHCSRYHIADIFANYAQFMQEYIEKSSTQALPWNYHKLQNHSQEFLLDNLISHNSEEHIQAFECLRKLGVVVIRNFSLDINIRKAQIDLLMRSMFPHVPNSAFVHQQRTNFQHISPITNCTFDSFDCGLQMLSIEALDEEQQYQTQITLVDGFNSAQSVRETHAEFFKELSSRRLCYNYNHSAKSYYEHRIETVRLENNEVAQIHFNPKLLQAQTVDNKDKLLRSLKAFKDSLNLSENQWNFEFEHDMFIILDNWRICWRIDYLMEEYSIPLQCQYLAHKYYKSRLQELKISL